MAWDQVFDEEIADFDSVTPAWDKEVDAVADFDAETDADNDLNDHADALHDGAVGLEITFDDANLAYGTMNLDAVDQTSGVVSLWFDPNDVAIDNNRTIVLATARDGASDVIFQISLTNVGGTYKIRTMHRTDATDVNNTFITIAMDYQHILVFWKASSGADDGFIHLFFDGVLVDSATGIDNDTADWDVLWAGMLFTNSASFGGSFYMDTIKIDPVGGPFASKLAVQAGTYGMAVPIMDTTARYGQLSDAVADAAVAVDFHFDPNSITMATNDQFTLAKCDGEFTIELKYTGSAYQVQLALTTDGGTDATSWHTITDAYHLIRVVWKASSGGGNDDGYTQLYVDSVLQEQILGMDTDTLSVDEVQYGAIAGLDAGTYGVIYMDNCQWNDAQQDSAQAGAFVSSGTVAKKPERPLAGPLVMTGAVAKKPKKPLAGVVTFIGTIVKKAKKAIAGTITFSGTAVLERLWLRFFARFRNYTFPALKRFTIASNAIVFLAQYRDYTFNAPKRRNMATTQDVWLEGTPFYLVEGATPKITVPFNWASTITGTPTVEVYKDNSSTDTAGTYMPTGTVTTSGASLTTKALAVLVPGKYVIVINAVVDGILDVWKLGMVVQKQESLW